MKYPVYLYIAVMAIVTYLIRMLPLTLIKKEIKNPFIRSFLYYVPYVTLSVMTFRSRDFLLLQDLLYFTYTQIFCAFYPSRNSLKTKLLTSMPHSVRAILFSSFFSSPLAVSLRITSP